MKERNHRYLRQRQNALKTYENLLEVKAEIDFKLKSNPICAHLHKDLRDVNLNIKITLNEIEHLESNLQECEI